jgi:hypothetical protein
MFTKNCPKCGKLQQYKHPTSYQTALKNNSVCTSCAQREANKKKVHCQKGYKNPKNMGENNHMYGRTIYDVWNEKYGTEIVAKLTQQHAEKSRHTGEKSGMFGRTVKSIWVTKYGQEEADRRHANWRASVGRSGTANAQYGKPAPKLSGRGIKGWLNGLFFRSLLEMQYIYYRISNGDTIIGAETGEFRVAYTTDDGKQKTYHPDFLVNNTLIIEIKPSALLSKNKLKIDAGIAAYRERYLVETEKSFPSLIDVDVYHTLILEGSLKILDSDIDRALKNIKKWKYVT